MTQRILVLGANGFIGRQVVAALSSSDWATPVPAGRRAAAAGQPASLQVDTTNGAQLRDALADVSGVVNCVAGGTDTIVNGARTLAEAAADAPQKPRIVHLSSLAVYGERVGDADETTTAGGELSPYGAAKEAAERLIQSHSDAVVLRLGIVYGPYSSQWSGRIAQLLHARRLGDLGGGGDGYCNLTYVADAVQGIISCLRRAVGGNVFNLSMRDPPTWNEYFTRYAIALGAVPVARISGRRLRIESKLLAPPLKVAEIIAGKVAPRLGRLIPQPIPPSLVRLFRQELRLQVARAETALGLEWTPLEVGLTRSAAWYGQQQY